MAWGSGVVGGAIAVVVVLEGVCVGVGMSKYIKKEIWGGGTYLSTVVPVSITLLVVPIVLVLSLSLSPCPSL